MIKRVFAIAIATLILVFACFPVSALDFLPFYAEGNSANNGGYSLVTGYIYGDFQMDPDYDYWRNDEFPIDSYFKIFRDERNEEGDGEVFYIANFTFANGFYSNGVYYNAIQVVLHAWDQEPRGTINDVNFIGPGYSISVFHKSGTGQGDWSYTPMRVSFGSSNNGNYPTISFGDQSDIWDFYYHWFSGPLQDGYITAFIGLFIPVAYYQGSGGEGGGSGGQGGGSGGEGGGTPAAGFTQFMGLIINSFKDILSINFFGGLFSLGDLIGIIVAFGILFLAIKWFAGG